MTKRKEQQPKYKQSETVVIKRSQINFAPYNPRKEDPEVIKKLKKNFKTVGYLGGIVWNQLSSYLVSGHKRVQTLDIINNYDGTPETDYEIKVEAVELDDKTEREQNIFMNSPSAMGEFDMEKIKVLVPEIDYKAAGLSEADMNIYGISVMQDEISSEFEISYLLKLNPKEEESQFLSFLAKATPQKQLFLHEVMSRNIHENVSNIKDLDAVIDWFVNSLKIIFPDTPYKQGVLLKAADDNDLKRGFGALLRYFNTGVDGVKLIDVQFEKLGIPHDLQRAIKTDLSKSNTDEAFGALRFDDNLYLINLIDGEIRAKKLMTVHKKMDEADIELFSLGDESDGTKRLFDYIPLILDLIQGGKVFIVDEMERSLHPSLIKQIILLFYKHSKDVSSQLIFTTHESSLMDQKIFRRDEIWLMKKDNNGISSFGRMDNLYNVRFDKMLQNSYLNGEYGATPIFETEEEINKLFSSLK